MVGDEITYKVSIYEKFEIYRGKQRTTYYVRWRVDGRECKEPFHHEGQAKNFRNSLTLAASKGEAFRTETGRPVSWGREEPKEPTGPPPVSWYSLTLDYTKAKWKFAAPNQRRSIAESLTDATEVMLASGAESLIKGEAKYSRAEVRRALQGWAFSTRLQGDPDPPGEIAPVIEWLEKATIPVVNLADTENGRARAVLDRISSKQDGTLAAANTANRKRTVLHNVMTYAEFERKLITGNPLKSITWTNPRRLKTVDPRCVINASQARRLLTAAGKTSDRGRRLKAFFGCMYYAAMRPEEVTDLRRSNITDLPENSGEWGEFLLTSSQPRSGSNWTDDGSVRQQQALKHRAKEETRTVPMHPELAQLLREHLAEFGTGTGGRVFTLARGTLVTDRAYLKVFHEARTAAFTAEEAGSLIARVPYDLRHAAVSTWLNAGVSPAQVAEWAGHSVDVLLRVYAKCVHGQKDRDKQRILDYYDD